jgi:hypothetical protein
MRREDDLEATESDKISTKDRKAEPFSPQKDNAVLTLYPELRTVDHKPKQHVNPIDRALKHPCRPLKESRISQSRTTSPSISKSRILPPVCNPTTRPGMGLAGFLSGPLWSASLRLDVSLVTKRPLDLCDVRCKRRWSLAVGGIGALRVTNGFPLCKERLAITRAASCGSLCLSSRADATVRLLAWVSVVERRDTASLLSL